MGVDTQSQMVEVASPARGEHSGWEPSYSRSSTLSDIEDVLDEAMSDVIVTEPAVRVSTQIDQALPPGPLELPRRNSTPDGSRLSSPRSSPSPKRRRIADSQSPPRKDPAGDDKTNLDKNSELRTPAVTDNLETGLARLANGDSGTKRKRETVSAELEDARQAKRPHSTDKSTLEQAEEKGSDGENGNAPAAQKDQTETNENEIPKKDDEEDKQSEAKPICSIDPVAAEDAPETSAAPTPRTPRPRKGKRKSKRLDEKQPGPIEDDLDEEDDEDGSTISETALKRKLAQEILGNIEKQFTVFREKHLNEQIEQVNRELALLREPNNEHPEFLAQMYPIDKRFAEKVDYESKLRKYRSGILRVRLVAESTQLHSQFGQEVREIRGSVLESGYEFLHSLQRDRRRWGADETIHVHMYNPRRSTQVRNQIAYNHEVSVLAGIAKHVGFPAAPDLRGLNDREISDDLEEMGIGASVSNQAGVSSATAANTIVGISSAFGPPRVKNEAEERFLEQTPWANPNHPAHLNASTNGFRNYNHPGSPSVPVAPTGLSYQPEEMSPTMAMKKRIGDAGIERPPEQRQIGDRAERPLDRLRPESPPVSNASSSYGMNGIVGPKFGNQAPAPAFDGGSAGQVTTVAQAESNGQRPSPFLPPLQSQNQAVRPVYKASASPISNHGPNKAPQSVAATGAHSTMAAPSPNGQHPTR